MDRCGRAESFLQDTVALQSSSRKYRAVQNTSEARIYGNGKIASEERPCKLVYISSPRNITGSSSRL